jgi:hypothetical protein
MTEAEWLACDDPRPMLAFLGDRASGRKLRLCASAWARSVLRHFHTAPPAVLYSAQPDDPAGGWLADKRWLQQVDAAERFADGEITPAALRAARQASGGPYNLFREVCSVSRFALGAVHRRLLSVQREFGAPSGREPCDLLRDILGNPFRPVIPFDKTWRSPTARRLAQAIYEGRAFDRLPVLADALEEAGCDDAEVLGHCRGGGEHVRGCWLVDLVLAKE